MLTSGNVNTDTLTSFAFGVHSSPERHQSTKSCAELEKAKTAISNCPDGRLSVIAHSYGTYVITEILASKLDLKLHRLLFCGSIVRRRYPWHAIGDRIAAHPTLAGKKNVLNDYGLRDVWPVLAKCLSWGYGDTGRHKFGKAEVIDRGHDLDHSGFFTKKAPDTSLAPGEQFVREFWKPWFETGEVVRSPVNEKGTSPLWLSWLSVLPLQWLIVVAMVLSFTWLLFGLFRTTNSSSSGNNDNGSATREDKAIPPPSGSQPTPADNKLAALTLHQELSKLRDVLSQPLRQERRPFAKYPDVYESGKLAKWDEPKKSSINQIVMLAETDPKAVVRTLIPLLSDSDGVVVAGARCAIRDIFIQQPKEAVSLRQLIPKGHEQPLNLRDAYIVNQDFSAFAGTDLFYSAHFEGAVVEHVKFDGVVLKLAEFARSTVLNCSFKNAVLDRSRWHDSRVRDTTFEGASMDWIYAENADFGTASSEPTTLFAPNVFYKAILNDAVLNRASIVGARLHNAKLKSAQFSGVDFTNAYMVGDKLVSEDLLRSAGAILLDKETKYGRKP